MILASWLLATIFDSYILIESAFEYLSDYCVFCEYEFWGLEKANATIELC